MVFVLVSQRILYDLEIVEYLKVLAGNSLTYMCVQVSRAAVEGYTGEGEPPCIVMTLRADFDKTTPPNLSLPVTLTGVRKQSKELQVYRPTEGNVISARHRCCFKNIKTTLSNKLGLVSLECALNIG